MAIATLASSPQPAHASPNLFGPPVPTLEYEGRWMLPSDSPSLLENRLNFSTPVAKTDSGIFSVSLGGSRVHLGDPVALDSRKIVPSNLARIEAGVQYFGKLPEHRTWGVRGSVGYAGDPPFRSGRDLTYGLAGHYAFPGSGHNAWVLMAFLSNNNPLVNYLPIPGFAYLYHSATLTGLFGFPLISVQWSPLVPWTYSLSIFGPLVDAEAAYGQRDHFQWFVHYRLSRESYLPSFREKERDRLTLEAQKIGAGFRFPLARTLSSEFQAGRAFGRALFVGEALHDRDEGTADLAATWFIAWGFKYGF